MPKAAKELAATAKEQVVEVVVVVAKGWVAAAIAVAAYWEPLSGVPDSPVPSKSTINKPKSNMSGSLTQFCSLGAL